MELNIEGLTQEILKVSILIEYRTFTDRITVRNIICLQYYYYGHYMTYQKEKMPGRTRHRNFVSKTGLSVMMCKKE